ncbi:MAG TPA: hypothetical protein VLA88_04185 [Candidatus Saccharimonadales bacterium]|nr:hypothetical protein [Candidatus Saccharimonadales bacterium]
MFKFFHKDHPVPKWMQLAFIVAVASSLLVNIGFTLSIMFQQSFTNENFSAFAGALISQSAMPVLLFGIAYYLNPRKLHPGERIFESMLLTFTALLGSGAIMQIFSYAGLQQLYGGEHYMAYQLVTGTITVVLFAVILWQLRASKRWK